MQQMAKARPAPPRPAPARHLVQSRQKPLPRSRCQNPFCHLQR